MYLVFPRAPRSYILIKMLVKDFDGKDEGLAKGNGSTLNIDAFMAGCCTVSAIVR
jgi:hypothetical protein